MSTSEIAKLESRWRDNPHGLTFAPLAEAYRKQRDPRKALEILLPGLERHPDYIPANIVLGRCHWDLNDLEGAEKAFTHVLGLDSENVIALKALADITERQSRPSEAERWLETLLAVDRSNDEAREQLARIRAVQSVSPVLETPAGVDISIAEVAASVVVPGTEPSAAESRSSQLEPEPAAAEPVAAEPVAAESAAAEPAAAEPAPARAGPGETYPDLLDPFPAIADQLPALEERAPDETAARWSASSASELEPTAFPDLGDFPPSVVAPPMAAASFERSAEPSPEPQGFDFERVDEIVLSVAGGSEFQGPSAAEELGSSEPAAEVAGGSDAAERPPERDQLAEAPPPPAALFGSYLPDAAAASYEPPSFEAPAYEPPAYETPVAESLPAGEPMVGLPSEAGAAAAPAPDPTDTAEPDLVVTETMAQVFLRQGHVVEALAVYRELAARDPGAGHLHDRVAQLEARQAAAAAPPPRPSLLARDTGGQSLGSFLAAVLAARLEPLPAAASGQVDDEVTPDAASATRPAEEPLSLGSVFGEDPPPVAPAVPPAGSAPAPIVEESGRAVSFDEFFAGSPVSAPAPAPAPRPSRPRSDDDLDQFHSWLQSLKR